MTTGLMLQTPLDSLALLVEPVPAGVVVETNGPVFGKDIRDPAFVARCHEAFRSARPFPHVVIDGLFRTEFLRNVSSEFGMGLRNRRELDTLQEHTFRSTDPHLFGTETTRYFDVMHRFAMVEFMSAISGVDNLIVDAALKGGGLHECHDGGWFDIHRDFNLHRDTMLDNELVAITYLNEDWHDDFGGHLELWCDKTRAVLQSIAPFMGRTVIFSHGSHSYHGHTKPVATGGTRCRRSLATYYYSNRSTLRKLRYHGSMFALDSKGRFAPSDEIRKGNRRSVTRRLKRYVRLCTPPIVWNAAMNMLGKF